MLTVLIEVSREGISRVRVPVQTLADQSESRNLLERIAVPLDLLHRAAQNFPEDDSVPALRPEPVKF